MLTLVRDILSLFSRRERRQLYLLFIATTMMALVEVAGIASVMPFMAVLADPGAIDRTPVLAWAYETFDFTSTEGFLLALGSALLAILVFRNLFIAVTTWFQLRFTGMQHHFLARRLLTGYLRQPYEFFLSKNTADLSTNILAEVTGFVNGVLAPALQILAHSVVAVAIILLLLVVEPILSTVVALTLSGAYVLIFAGSRRGLSRLGEDRLKANKQRYRAATEALGGIKELKVLGSEHLFVDRFAYPSRRFARASAIQLMVAQLPRFALETLAFGGIIGIALYLLATEGNVAGVLPLLAMYALAAYRLLPALQQIFNSLTTLRFYRPSLEAIRESLPSADEESVGEGRVPAALTFTEAVELRHLGFSYPDTDTPVIQDLSVRIQEGSSVAFVGPTGSGKSTVVDLLVGLLRPHAGGVLVDGIELDDTNVSAWQALIGYVPQHIYLADDTIGHNIALGVPEDEIDEDQLHRVARAAQLYDFVMANLPNGFETEIGERGVRLSGGQRQRVGIARALYRTPSVLVLDEATSALDGETERRVMDALDRSEVRTIIMVAHRLTTVEHCDVIYVMNNGRIESAATYAELQKSSPVFKAMLGKL